VEQHRVEPRVASDYFPSVPGGRVAIEYDRYFLSETGKHRLQINDKGVQITMS
jgi:hypothetical protein